MNMLEMGKQGLLRLEIKDVVGCLGLEEVVHIAKAFGAFWAYDYKAAEEGRVGMHAILKSGLHSDKFFVSRIFLGLENIRHIVAYQMSKKIKSLLGDVDISGLLVGGVPNGATELGESIAKILGTKTLVLKKISGQIKPVSQFFASDRILLVEDLCTKGTGFLEAVRTIRDINPRVVFVPINPVIINRGKLTHISDVVDRFKILPLVCMEVNEWNPLQDGCPLCFIGSIAIKPKETDENWEKITTSQL